MTPVPIRSTDELIPDAVHGQDVYGPVRLRLDLPSQLDDEVVDGPVVWAGFEAPNLFEDLVPRYRLALAFPQELEQLHFIERQVHRIGTLRQGLGAGFDLDVADPNLGL